MLVLISLLPLLLFLSFFNRKEEPESAAKERTAESAARTAKRKKERQRQRQREHERNQLLKPKAPDAGKLQAFIAALKKKLKQPQDLSLKELVAFEARKLLALSTFLRGQQNKCSYHNALLCAIHRELVGYVVIPNWKIMRRIVNLSHGKILSIGSGQAAFEACMLPHVQKKRFRTIICTDICPDVKPIMSVINMDSVSAVKRYGDITETCIICWPDLDESHTLEALQARNVPFPCIIYVGETRGGCCGNDALFDYFDTFYKEAKCFLIKGFSDDAVTVYHLK
jgi:hypothetical protein